MEEGSAGVLGFLRSSEAGDDGASWRTARVYGRVRRWVYRWVYGKVYGCWRVLVLTMAVVAWCGRGQPYGRIGCAGRQRRRAIL